MFNCRVNSINKIKLIKMSHMNSFVHLTDLLCTQTCLLVSILHEQTLFAAKYVHQTVVLICDIFINLMFFSVFLPFSSISLLITVGESVIRLENLQ